MASENLTGNAAVHERNSRMETAHTAVQERNSRMETAIEAKGIKKKFKVYYDKGRSLKERILFKKRRQYEEHWVLKGIDIEVKKGESVGLIGKNGCGKSTTLKMFARIIYPTEGIIKMHGRVSSLIELGAGFHPDLSGRENIFTNASIFGLNRREIEKRMDAVIQFSELEAYIDQPVRTYSSGMYMRLAFAVAVNVDADILLIDEILSVGDVNFQAKCFEKLKEIKAKGTTIVIVSHAMGQIQDLCDRVIWIEDGFIRMEGRTKEAAAQYLAEMEKERRARIEMDFQQKVNARRAAAGQIKNGKQCLHSSDFCTGAAHREGNHEIYFTNAEILDAQGRPAVFFPVCGQMEIRMAYHAEKTGQTINFIVNITKDDGTHCFGTTALSAVDGSLEILSKENGEVSMVVNSMQLLKGRYLADIGIQDMKENKYDYIYNALEFRVEEEKAEQSGIICLPRVWKIDGKELGI